MQLHWLNKQNNDKLIIFFAGWSFDYKPFEFLDCEVFDVTLSPGQWVCLRHIKCAMNFLRLTKK